MNNELVAARFLLRWLHLEPWTALHNLSLKEYQRLFKDYNIHQFKGDYNRITEEEKEKDVQCWRDFIDACILTWYKLYTKENT